MDLFVVLAIVFVACLGLYCFVKIVSVPSSRYLQSTERPPSVESPENITARFEWNEPHPYVPSEGDEEFEAPILKVMGPHIEKHFYNKVVGITFKNEDGGPRENLIGSLEPFDFVDLVCEPENPYDPNAVAVHKQGGPRLGYLNRHTAEEVATSVKKHRAVWLACVKRAQPRTKSRHAYLLICLMKMTEEWVEARTAHSIDASHEVPSCTI